jgi:PhzF family phenazine biosynthesis protein
MHCPIYQLDAFTDRLFSGNPAAVVLLEHEIPDHVMQAVAAENNLSETAFVVTGGPVFPLRWFTPTVEIDLCGHATLAAAHVLFRHVVPESTGVEFSTQSGILRVTREGQQLTLDFPSRPGIPAAVTGDLVDALGVRPREVLRARDLLAVLDSESQVRALRPDMARLAALDGFAVIVTAPGDSVDFVSRFFAPGAGVPEDPVTGSAHCTLSPYWAERLGRTTLVAKQVSPRGGDLTCRLAGDRVFLTGQVVEYLQGGITLPG